VTEQHNETREAALAEVHRLPVRQAGDALEGELVSDAEFAARQAELRRLRHAAYLDTGRAVVRVTRTVVTHDHTATAGRALVRHGSYVLGGIGVVAKRARDRRTGDRYERIMDRLESAGEFDRLDVWECKSEKARQARHQRRMDWLGAPGKLVKAAAIGLGSVTALLLVLGIIIAIASQDPSQIVGPLLAIVTAIQWTYWLVSAYFALLVGGATTLAALWLWRLGRKADTAPEWTMPAARHVASEGALITPPAVVNAFRHLGISDLRKAIKAMEDGGAGMLSSITIAGCGVEVDVLLPRGITTEEIQKRRRKLAENLDRHEHELFITIPKQARTVRLWVADPGALDEPIEASPLITSPPQQVSMFRDRAPWGQNLRGDAIGLNLWQKHLLITGLSNMGKTASLRSLALWLLFDPTVEFRIADLKGIGDWKMFRGIATTYIAGPTDDHAVEATHMLEAGVREMEQRLLNFDEDKYPDGVPPGLTGYHPIILLVDEAQVAFMNPEVDGLKRPYGGKANNSRYFMAARKIHNQGRAVNVLLWQGTQDPTDQNLPKLVREGAHIRASLKVGSESQSRMALGENAVNDGAAPHELQQEHKGTVVATGAGVPCQQGQTSEIVRTHFINGTDGTAIADQAKQIRGGGTTADDAPVERDLLADVLAESGDEDAPRAADLAVRLRKLAPGYRPYQNLTGESLAEQLERDYGVKRGSQGGIVVVRTQRVRHAMAEREMADDED
jgi:S-DNA-T family DNA segregation ATPase FtsK/SpoIIIE